MAANDLIQRLIGMAKIKTEERMQEFEADAKQKLRELEEKMGERLQNTQKVVVGLKRDIIQKTQKIVVRHHEMLRNLRFHLVNPELRCRIPDFFMDDFLQKDQHSAIDALKVINMLESAPRGAH